MDISFYNPEGGSIIAKNDLNISWNEDTIDYKERDIIETWFEIENNTGSDFLKLKLEINPDLSIWNFNDRNNLLSEINIQAIIDNLMLFGTDSYEEIVFVKPTKYVNPRNTNKDVRIFTTGVNLNNIIYGLMLRANANFTINDNFGFAISEGHLHVNVAQDNSGVPGTYYKSVVIDTFANGSKIKFWVKTTVPASWDSHKNPLVAMIKAYVDNQLVDNYLRVCYRNVYSVLWIPIHGNIIKFAAEDLPFEVGV